MIIQKIITMAEDTSKGSVKYIHSEVMAVDYWHRDDTAHLMISKVLKIRQVVACFDAEINSRLQVSKLRREAAVAGTKVLMWWATRHMEVVVLNVDMQDLLEMTMASMGMTPVDITKILDMRPKYTHNC